MSKQDFTNIKDNIIDSDEVGITDIKLNPDYFIHISLTGAIKAMQNPDLTAGFMQYVLLVDTALSVAKGNGRLIDGHKDRITDFKKTEEYKNQKDDLAKKVLLAKEKFELIIESIGSSQTIIDPLKDERKE